MRRKFSSIFLLVSFLGLIAHDMIPHHHEHMEQDEISHVVAHSHHHGENHDEEQRCSDEKAVNIETEHHCPHHVHQCPSHVYDLSNILTVSKTVKLKSHKTLLSRISVLANNVDSKKSQVFLEPKIPLPKYHLCGAGTLRAPPSFS